MKRVTFIIIILFTGFINAQKLSNKEIKILNDLNVETNNLDLNNFGIQNKLNKILILNSKRKTNKTIGITLSILSAGGIITGSSLISKNQPATDALGNIIIVGGAISGGVSIPFWISTIKRKKERNELIKMF